MEFEKESEKNPIGSGKEVIKTSQEGQESISETGKKLLDFFDRFGTDSEKIGTFEQNVMSAQNVGIKTEIDKVISSIQKQAQNNPQSQLNQTIKQESKSNEGQKVIEICLMCGRTRNQCAGYANMGQKWPYFREFITNNE